MINLRCKEYCFLRFNTSSLLVVGKENSAAAFWKKLIIHNNRFLHFYSFVRKTLSQGDDFQINFH